MQNKDYSLSHKSSTISEYEEFDINDIYPYKSPKYKTLIEVDISDTTTNKPTDNEWNQLKQDFTAQYLNHTGPYVPLNNDIGEEATFNIHWNVPENINRTTNIMNNPKYVSNNIYTGIDLIHDSLSRNYNVDIHNEMLKRKENELF
ncbi:hypothetical protein PFUGPA_01208 [Plasmodium falciparum Palo Alto/Uganda]|uniref:Plasmodium falciparum erythrocyte membrane protein 1 acidic terminal segment domain-containing protein n=2 Tax=Plasmodium falciparum TaxID=5833 RepID=W4J563_PLAFP|nr:hypothetical protein PFUGPA_01208 [Plasmodium falciparum Palo Alto/Uganda]ETW61234.1 hypothetical protein PFMC_02654 [Plasmodium falciparum CAMP/Malaysia]